MVLPVNLLQRLFTSVLLHGSVPGAAHYACVRSDAGKSQNAKLNDRYLQLRVGVCENRDGWLVAWGLCGSMLIRFSTGWLLPFTLL